MNSFRAKKSTLRNAAFLRVSLPLLLVFDGAAGRTSVPFIAILQEAFELGRHTKPVIGLMGHHTSAQTSAFYPNPLTQTDAADPSLLAHGNQLYLYSTGCMVRGGGAYPISVTSREDRTSWTSVGGVFSKETFPQWTMVGRCKYWAPEVHRIAGQLVCYFSVWDQNERFCIGAATSDSPAGPFRDVGAPLVSNPEYGLIDAGYFHDPITRRHWLMWKEDKNALTPQQPTNILIQELTSNGLAVKNEAVVLIANDQEWEHELVEAPSLIYRSPYYYLFYSANGFSSDLYGVGVARSTNVNGPYHKFNKNPILKSNKRFDGPGHQFLFEESPGVWTMFYHARDRASASRSRLLMSDPVRWSKTGWPYIKHGTPSDGWTTGAATSKHRPK
ncbi:MAG: glycoside hydrolase family 43 protein [Candidatus Sumerlaeaceae bacterium]